MKQNKSERVVVNVRIRPFTEDEKKKDPSTPFDQIDTKRNILTVKKDYDQKTFSYDKVFSLASKQEEIFESSSREVVESVLKGYNGTIFAYGQTGTGKTYTMVGDFENDKSKGVIPRAFDLIFDRIPKDKEHKYNVKVSFIQIYLEAIQDLLEPKNKDIRIREDPEQGVYLEGVQWIKVNSTADCANVFHFGEKNRVTESTKMNLHSSRSHAIFIVRIEKNIMLSQEKIAELSKESNEQIKAERVMTNSMLFLVDLAGSERVKKTKAENMRLEEAKKINYSLLVLGNCIQSLTDSKSSHVSYRDSKLTRLLQESLGGNAKTCLIVTVSPSGYNTDETVSSLNFALRAMKVQNKPIINKSIDYQALSIKLQEDLDKLNDQYCLLKIDYDKVADENAKMKSGEVFVEMQRKSIVNSIQQSNSSSTEEKNVFALAKDAKKSKSPQTPVKQEADYAEEVKKLEAFYEGVLQSKTEEYEGILKEIDLILAEKENQIEAQGNELTSLKERSKKQDECIEDIQKEKVDLMESVSDLTNKLAYEKESTKANTIKEHKSEMDKLTAVIESLEARVIEAEKANDALSKVSPTIVNAFSSKVEADMKKLIERKNELLQQKNTFVIKSSQNEIKMKIDNDELGNLKKKLGTVTEEMKKIIRTRISETSKEIKAKQEENKMMAEEKGRICLMIADFEKEVKIKKAQLEELGSVNDCAKKDKSTCFCETIINSANMQIELIKRERLQKSLDISLEEKEKLQNEMILLKDQNIKLALDVNKQNEKMSLMAKEKDMVSSDKSAYEKEIESLKNDNAKLAARVEEMNKVNKEAKVLNEELQDELVSLQQCHKDNEGVIQDLSRKVDEAQRLLQVKAKELIEAKADCNSKGEELHKAKEAIKELDEQLNMLNANLKAKEATIQSSINANENFNKEMTLQIEEFEKSKAFLSKESAALKQAVIQLTKDKKHNEEQLEAMTNEKIALEKVIKDNASALSQLTSELNQHKLKEKEMAGANNQLHGEIEGKENQLKELARTIDLLQQEAAQKEAEVVKEKDTIEALESKLFALSEEVVRREEIIQSSMKEHEALNKQMKAQLDDFNTQKAQLSKEIIKLNKEHSHLTKEIVRLTTELQMKEEAITALTRTTTEQAASIEENQLAVKELTDQLDSLKVKHSALINKLKQSEEAVIRLTGLNEQLTELKKNNEALLLVKSLEKDKQLKEASFSQEQLKEKAKEISLLNEAKAKLQKDLQMNEKQLIEVKASFDTITKELENKSTDVSSKLSEVCRLTVKNQSLKSQIASLTLKSNADQAAIKALEAKEKELFNSAASLQTELKALMQSIQQKDAELHALSTKMQLKEAEMAQLIKDNGNLNHSLKETEASLAIKAESCQSLEASSAKELSMLKEENNELQASITTTVNTIRSLNKQITDSVDAFSKYQNELSNAQAQLSSFKAVDIALLSQYIDNDSISDEDDDNIHRKTSSRHTTESHQTLEQSVKLLTDKCRLTQEKISSMKSVSCSLIQLCNKSIEANTLIKSNQIEKLQKLLTMLSLKDISSVPLVQKRIYSLSSTSSLTEVLANAADIQNDLLNKHLATITEKEEEISHLNDRIDYFIKELEILRKTNEETSKGASSSAKIQLMKYESQLKLKGEEIDRMNKRLEQHLKTINSHKKEITALQKEIDAYQSHIKQLQNNLETQNESIEAEQKHKLREKIKVANKDLNTGKFIIKEFMSKTAKYGIDLLRYCESSND